MVLLVVIGVVAVIHMRPHPPGCPVQTSNGEVVYLADHNC